KTAARLAARGISLSAEAAFPEINPTTRPNRDRSIERIVVMNAQSIGKYQMRFASVAMLTALLGVFVTPRAFAAIARTNAARVVSVTMSADNARQLTVKGSLACGSEGPRAYIHVRVTQRSTGAVAEGSMVADCTGGAQNWEVRAGAQGKPAFEE